MTAFGQCYTYELTYSELFREKVYILIVTARLPRDKIIKRFFQLIFGLHYCKKGIPKIEGIGQGKIENFKITYTPAMSTFNEQKPVTDTKLPSANFTECVFVGFS